MFAFIIEDVGDLCGTLYGSRVCRLPAICKLQGLDAGKRII